MSLARDLHRRRAIQRRRPPDQDAKNDAAARAVAQRVETALANVVLLQRLNAAAGERSSGGTG